MFNQLQQNSGISWLNSLQLLNHKNSFNYETAIHLILELIAAFFNSISVFSSINNQSIWNKDWRHSIWFLWLLLLVKQLKTRIESPESGNQFRNQLASKFPLACLLLPISGIDWRFVWFVWFSLLDWFAGIDWIEDIQSIHSSKPSKQPNLNQTKFRNWFQKLMTAPPASQYWW